MENKDNNIVVNAKPNTILLQSTEEEVTGGYYDGAGEWHEFGGGGEGSIRNPIVNVKFINHTLDNAFVSQDGEMVINDYITNTDSIPALTIGEEMTLKMCAFVYNYEGMPEELNNKAIWRPQRSNIAISELVNCTYTEDGYGGYLVVVTDITQDASCTIELLQGE